MTFWIYFWAILLVSNSIFGITSLSNSNKYSHYLGVANIFSAGIAFTMLIIHIFSLNQF